MVGIGARRPEAETSQVRSACIGGLVELIDQLVLRRGQVIDLRDIAELDLVDVDQRVGAIAIGRAVHNRARREGSGGCVLVRTAVEDHSLDAAAPSHPSASGRCRSGNRVR